ncbi:hypothetical protein EV363DRAFT_1171747, partial [Boletus edulis]
LKSSSFLTSDRNTVHSSFYDERSAPTTNAHMAYHRKKVRDTSTVQYSRSLGNRTLTHPFTVRLEGIRSCGPLNNSR